MISKRLEYISNLQPQELPVVLRKMAADSKNEQKNTLFDILECAKNTEFGKDHKFDSITTIEDFREIVPVSDFDDYKDVITRLENAEENVLFDGVTTSFLASTGTSGHPKNIPESQNGYIVTKTVGMMRSVEMLRNFPELLRSDFKLLAITNGSAISKTKGGIPIGTASGQAVSQSDGSAGKFVIPAELLKHDLAPADMDYMMILYAAACKDIRAVICNNMLHLSNLITLLNHRLQDICSDIRNGSISIDISSDIKNKLLKYVAADPKRADEIEKIYSEKGNISAQDLWPGLIGAGTWLSSSVGRIAREVKRTLPSDVGFMHWGYGASEGKFDVPVEKNCPDGIPVVFGYFFEFRDLTTGEILLLDETEDEKPYEFIITSYSGFYRYNIHDIVKLRTGKDGLKRIEFVCKTKDSIDLNGIVLYANELTDMIEEYENVHNIYFPLFQGENISGRLKLYIEPESEYDKQDFTEFISDKLKEKNIVLDSVEERESGYRRSLFVDKLKDGQSVNRTKIQVFV